MIQLLDHTACSESWKNFEFREMVTQTDQGGMYLRLKELQRQLEILEIQEEYIRDETKNLKREMIRAKVCQYQ